MAEGMERRAALHLGSAKACLALAERSLAGALRLPALHRGIFSAAGPAFR